MPSRRRWPAWGRTSSPSWTDAELREGPVKPRDRADSGRGQRPWDPLQTLNPEPDPRASVPALLTPGTAAGVARAGDRRRQVFHQVRIRDDDVRVLDPRRLCLQPDHAERRVEVRRHLADRDD